MKNPKFGTWISVSDRLPKEYGGYLVYENGFRFVACFHVDNFVDENMLIVKPTHWMPLPPKPN